MPRNPASDSRSILISKVNVRRMIVYLWNRSWGSVSVSVNSRMAAPIHLWHSPLLGEPLGARKRRLERESISHKASCTGTRLGMTLVSVHTGRA